MHLKTSLVSPGRQNTGVRMDPWWAHHSRYPLSYVSPHMILVNLAGHAYVNACECKKWVIKNEGDQLSLLRGLMLCGVSLGASLIRFLLSCSSLSAGACTTTLPETRKKVLSTQFL